ncbi:hypothetical protein Sps_04547 [Shewanella psychrophila]|uniref:SH3 domain-containing protein n=1 Tax=Shewanella psychrophila TaxID=225848 RepID=A0A1S6HVY5_9GAMM|nr:hypothetical protein [Shewanella psychrophila]AQS39632.1 hypothetical protein Sps_04547 [Shewanella psychrophila]
MKKSLMKQKRISFLLVLPLMAMTSSIFSQKLASQEITSGDKASLVRDTELKAKPYSDANTLKVLAEALPVDVLSRQSSWLEIQAEAMTGWVKMFSVRYDLQSVPSSDSFSGTKQVFNLVTTGSSGSTVTTASRGLDENKFSEPSPNPYAFKTMQSFAVSGEDAQSFARDESLNEQQQDYVTVSAEVSAPSSDNVSEETLGDKS